MNWKGGLAGAGAGAGAGSAFGPYGALAGGVIGGIGGMFMPEGDVTPPAGYQPPKSDFQMPSSGQYFGPLGEGAFWNQQGNVAAPDDQYVGQARGWGMGARKQYSDMLQDYLLFATGARSMAREESKAALDRARRQVASQAASGARWNPAVQRAAMYAQSGMGQDIAADVASAATAEQQAAMRGYLGAVGQMRGQDLAAQQAEAGWWGNQAQFNLGVAGLKQKYLQMGLDDKMASQQALIEYHKLMGAGQGQNLQSWGAGQAAQGQQNQFYTQLGMGGLAGMGKGLGGWSAQQGGQSQSDPYGANASAYGEAGGW